MSELTKLRTALAESQAREAKLRDALTAVVVRMRGVPAVQGDEFKDLGMQARAAMNLRSDDTALRKMIAAAKNEGLEEAASVAGAADKSTHPADLADAIRARKS